MSRNGPYLIEDTSCYWVTKLAFNIFSRVKLMGRNNNVIVGEEEYE